jgi:hypothetical protein
MYGKSLIYRKTISHNQAKYLLCALKIIVQDSLVFDKTILQSSSIKDACNYVDYTDSQLNLWNSEKMFSQPNLKSYFPFDSPAIDREDINPNNTLYFLNLQNTKIGNLSIKLVSLFYILLCKLWHNPLLIAIFLVLPYNVKFYYVSNDFNDDLAIKHNFFGEMFTLIKKQFDTLLIENKIYNKKYITPDMIDICTNWLDTVANNGLSSTTLNLHLHKN